MNQPHFAATLNFGESVVGIPIRSINWPRLHALTDVSGGEHLLVTLGHSGAFMICDVRIDTGQCQQISCPGSSSVFPTAALPHPQLGQLFVATAYDGHLHRYDPLTQTLTDLGTIHQAWCKFPCRLALDTQGHVLVGGYPGCSLHRYDPMQQRWLEHQQVDPAEQYFYPQVAGDGTLAGVIRMMQVQLAIYDTHLPHWQRVGPRIDTDHETGFVHLLRATDEQLYVHSSKGDFRLTRTGLEAVAQLPPLHVYEHPPGVQEPLELPRFPGGRMARFLDAEELSWRRVGLFQGDCLLHAYDLNWVSQGSRIFMLHLGPDERMYGSPYLPERLFSCQLDGSQLTDHGRCSASDGEACSMANHRGRLFIASYRFGNLSVYDPTLPWHFGDSPTDNPRHVGRIDPVADRPRCMIVGPDDQLWVASVADYGHQLGPLTRIDPQHFARQSFFELHPGSSPWTLASLPNTTQLLVGLTIDGGTGTTPTASTAALTWFDTHTLRVTGCSDLDTPALIAVHDLLIWPDGHAVAMLETCPTPHLPRAQRTSQWELVAFDAPSAKVKARLPWPSQQWGDPTSPCLRPFEHTHLLLGSWKQVVRMTRELTEPEVVWLSREHPLHALGPLANGTLWLGCRQYLLRISLAPLSSVNRTPMMESPCPAS